MSIDIDPSLQPRDIKALSVFVAIVEAGGLSAAQAKLGCSLSFISSELTHFEKRLELALCTRGRNGFALTEAGHQVYEASRKVLNTLSGFDSAVSGLQRFVGGELRIATNEGDIMAEASILPQVIDRLLSRPGMRVRIRLEIGSFDRILSDVVKGDVHIGFAGFQTSHAGVRKYRLRKEPVSLYCGSKHPLFAKAMGPVTRSVLEKYQFATRPHAPSPFGLNWEPYRVSAIAPSMEARALMVISGRYLSFISDHYAAQWVDLGMMRKVIGPHLSYDGEAHMIVRESKHNPTIVKLFVEDYFATAAKLKVAKPSLSNRPATCWYERCRMQVRAGCVPCQPILDSAVSKRASASSISSAVITSGGMKIMVDWFIDVPLMYNPAA